MPEKEMTAIEAVVAERAKIELERLGQRARIKDKHREELKSFDKGTRKLLAANREQYVAALKAGAG